MTTKDFLLTIYLILRITISCQNSTASQFISTVTQTNTLQINSTLSTTSNQFSLKQTSSMGIDTITPSSINNMTTRNDTITTFPSNMTIISSNRTTTNETMATSSSNMTIISSNRTTTNETMTPFPSNRTTTNETMTPFPSNRTTTNETMTPFPSNRTTTNETMTPFPSNMTTISSNMTATNETMTTSSSNRTATNETMTTFPSNMTTSSSNITTTNETMTTFPSNMTTISSNMTATNDTTMNQTTIIYDLPGGTDEPARPGEFSCKVRMGCKFKRKFNRKYKEKDSKEYADFTNDIFFTMRLNLKKYFRLIMIIFIAIDEDGDGIALSLEYVLASTSAVSAESLSNNVKEATSTAYGTSMSVLSVNITQESVIVQSTTKYPTTINSSTINPTTIAYDLPGGTDQPPRAGEYWSKVRMGCSFSHRSYHINLKSITSQEYRDFTYEIYFTMRWHLRRYFRLIVIQFISLDPGSIVANMEFSLGSNTSVPSANISSFVQDSAVAGFGSSIKITSVAVTQESTLVSPTTTSTPSVPGWGIFLIVLACIVVITTVILLTIFSLKYQKSKSRDLTPYIHDSPNDKQGILLRRAKVYDSL